MRKPIVEVLIERDGLTREEAEKQVYACKQDLQSRLESGDMPMDICEEYFGLEPDYMDDLI